MDGSSASNRLVFASARKKEIPDLVKIYNGVWGKNLQIEPAKVRKQIEAFKSGQLVGHLDSQAVTLISTFPFALDPSSLFDSYDYDRLTSLRTFSDRLDPLDFDSKRKEGKVPVLLCVSIATRSDHLRSGFASETLHHVLRFASSLGVPALPYSAPRSLRKVRDFLPNLDLQKYLHLSKAAANLSYEQYCAKLASLSKFDHIRSAFTSEKNPSGKINPLSEDVFDDYSTSGKKVIASEDPSSPLFAKFNQDFGSAFSFAYGRKLTLEDFLLLTGRRSFDPVMDMHIQHGARFFRRNGSIVVVENSRPLDLDSCGYNVPLVYGFDADFGH
jgi:hypothetical protein